MRGLFWVAAWFVGSYVAYAMQVAHSQAAFDAGDRSAFAWYGFLPFIIPIFMMQSSFVVVPVAAVVELLLWVWRRKR